MYTRFRNWASLRRWRLRQNEHPASATTQPAIYAPMSARDYKGIVGSLVLGLGFMLCGGRKVIAQEHPVELSLGWNYALDDQGDGFANANGWYGTLNWARFERVGFTISHESYWGGYRGVAFNQHVYLGGLTFKLRKGEPRFSPFVQPFGGDTRVSYAGAIENQPTFELAAGADIRLKRHLSIEIIPAEYAYAHGSVGSLHNYQAGAGLEYTFRRKNH